MGGREGDRGGEERDEGGGGKMERRMNHWSRKQEGKKLEEEIQRSYGHVYT